MSCRRNLIVVVEDCILSLLCTWDTFHSSLFVSAVKEFDWLISSSRVDDHECPGEEWDADTEDCEDSEDSADNVRMTWDILHQNHFMYKDTTGESGVTSLLLQHYNSRCTLNW